MTGQLAAEVLSAQTRRRIHQVADEVAAELDLDARLQPYQQARCQQPRRADGGDDQRPVLHLEDVTGIPFVSEVPGVQQYQHRARVRAGDGALFAAVTAPADGYESYCRDQLELGRPQFIGAEPVDGPMAIARACREGRAFDTLKARASQAGGMVIHPYMAIEAVWALADALADDAVEVDVVGPPPPVLWLANDKASLAGLIERVTDGRWNVETHCESTPEALVRRLGQMADRHDRVGLKRTRCASAMGNLVFDSHEVRRAEPVEVDQRVRQFLDNTEWVAGESVLVVEWAAARASPSTQMWIPPAGAQAADASVRLDGIYQQLLSGPERVFVGSKPSTLGESVDRQLADASFVMAELFQQLGYVGRCSFDFLVVDDPAGGADIRMTECNGRWGGTSTPMRLVDRLVGRPRPAYVAQDFVHPDLVGCSFEQLRQAIGDELFDARSGRGRFVLYNCGPLRRRGKFDVISLGDTPDDAQRGVERVLPDLLGLH